MKDRPILSARQQAHWRASDTRIAYGTSLRLDSEMGCNSTIMQFTDKGATYVSTVWQYDRANHTPTQYRLTLGVQRLTMLQALLYPGECVQSQWTVQRRSPHRFAVHTNRPVSWGAWEKVEASPLFRERLDSTEAVNLWRHLTASDFWRQLVQYRDDGAREAMDGLTDPAEIEAWAEWGGPQLGG